MSTITLPNIRVSSDLTVKVRLKDGGVAIDWSTLSNIRALIYSDAQRAMAGRCAVSIDAEDATLLVCQYAANKPQYLGVNRIVVSATYQGETKTYDKPALKFVRWTDDQAGQEITISDPDVDVEIEVEDISSSILQEAVDAAFSAAERADEAAAAAEHMVDIHQGPPGPAGKAPYIDETTGNWFVWDDQTEQYVDSGNHAQGATGNGIASWSVVESQEDGGSNVVTVVFTNGESESLTVKNGNTGATPNFAMGLVTTGEPGSQAEAQITGTPANPILSLKIPQGEPGVAAVRYIQVDTLPSASSHTTDALYLVPTNTADVFDVYYTSRDGQTYSWVKLCTTSVQLSDYATKAEVTQLEHKVDSLPRGKDYGFFTSSSLLPSDATEEGFAYVGATEPYAIWQFDGTSWSDSGVTANAFSARPEDVQNAVDEYLTEHPTATGTFMNAAKQKLINLLEKVAFIDEHGQDYIDELYAHLFISPIDHIEAVYTQGSTKIYDIYSLDQLKTNLVVIIYYTDGEHAVTSDYSLSGTLVGGTSTITVSVLDSVTEDTVTDTFDVTVIGTTKLYLDGDECTSLTGGWQNKGFNLTAGTPTASKKSDHILIEFDSMISNQAASKTFSTVNAITLTGKTQIIIEADCYNAAGTGTLWTYFPASLAESTTQSGAFGSNYSSNRSQIRSYGYQGRYYPNPATKNELMNVAITTTNSSAYISVNLNIYDAYTVGAYVKIRKVVLAAE